jgi:hypothetical protein
MVALEFLSLRAKLASQQALMVDICLSSACCL